ncbi:hypothetical protein AAMO2058_000663600 [Amorphochlora amoebiformis]
MSDESRLSDNMASVAHSVAGGLSGVLSQIILYPLETIKYQQQAAGARRRTKKAKGSNGHANGCSDEEFETAKWSDMLKLEFYKTAYQGLAISLAETGCFHGIHFYFYTLLKKGWLRRNNAKQMTPLAGLMNGSLAGFGVQLVTSPLKVLQINSVLYKDEGTMELATRIYMDEGITGFWRGFGVNTILVINPAITFLVYETVRRKVHRLGIKGPLIDFLCGLFGKFVATVLTYPAMLLKTRLLTGDSTSLAKISKEITAKNGILGWFEGLGAKMTQTTLTNAFVFMFKEQLVRYTLRLFVLLFAVRREQKAREISKAISLASALAKGAK